MSRHEFIVLPLHNFRVGFTLGRMKTKTPSPTKQKRTVSFNGLEHIRISHGIPTRKALAKLLGISEMQTGKICRDATTSMNKETMEIVLNKFPDVTIADLIVES